MTPKKKKQIGRTKESQFIKISQPTLIHHQSHIFLQSELKTLEVATISNYYFYFLSLVSYLFLKSVLTSSVSVIICLSTWKKMQIDNLQVLIKWSSLLLLCIYIIFWKYIVFAFYAWICFFESDWQICFRLHAVIKKVVFGRIQVREVYILKLRYKILFFDRLQLLFPQITIIISSVVGLLL